MRSMSEDNYISEELVKRNGMKAVTKDVKTGNFS